MKMVKNIAKYRDFEHNAHRDGLTVARVIRHPFFTQKLLVERRQRDRHFKSIVQLTL